jgi:MYXO-CTERM domain-containing protein
MRRERWLIFTFVPAFMLLNAFVVLNYAGLSYQPFSWKAFAGMYPDGAMCEDPTDCISGNCVDDVCCDTPCTGAGLSCNCPGSVGTCTTCPVAPAPTLSGIGLLIAAALLAAIGSLGLLRRRRDDV